MSARIRGKIKLNGMQAFAAHSLLLQSRGFGTLTCNGKVNLIAYRHKGLNVDILEKTIDIHIFCMISVPSHPWPPS